jgi:hypothetical protein
VVDSGEGDGVGVVPSNGCVAFRLVHHLPHGMAFNIDLISLPNPFNRVGVGTTALNQNQFSRTYNFHARIHARHICSDLTHTKTDSESGRLQDSRGF